MCRFFFKYFASNSSRFSFITSKWNNPNNACMLMQILKIIHPLGHLGPKLSLLKIVVCHTQNNGDCLQDRDRAGQDKTQWDRTGQGEAEKDRTGHHKRG